MNRFEYINKLIPVCWEPGHMGTFLLRLLAHKYVKYSNSEVLKYFNHDLAYEWKVEDRIGSYFGYPDDERRGMFNFDKSLPFVKFTETANIHILLQLTKDYFTAESFSQKTSDIKWNRNLSKEEIAELYYNNFDDISSVFPYIKAHMFVFCSTELHRIPFKKIIVSLFPKDKEWLAEILLFYKHYYYWVKYNQSIQKQDFFINRIRKINSDRLCFILENNGYSEPKYANKWQSAIESHNDVITIDMYDLIFNKNTDQLKLIDPEYDFKDQSLIDLLDIVEQQTKEICHHFNLDTGMSLLMGQDLSPLKTKEVIDAVNLVKEFKNKLLDQ